MVHKPKNDAYSMVGTILIFAEAQLFRIVLIGENCRRYISIQPTGVIFSFLRTTNIYVGHKIGCLCFMTEGSDDTVEFVHER